MGIISMLKDTVFAGLFREKKVAFKANCLKCNAVVTADMERCPKCGTHLSSMFQLECPQCKEHNAVTDTKCKKCGYGFVHPEEPSGGGREYVCPICGYRANYYMLSCPSCGTRFA